MVRQDKFGDGGSQNIPNAHAILVVIFGTTMSELAVVLHAQLFGMQDLVPWRCLVVDSLRYEDMMTRLVQTGYTEKQVTEAIPRSNYLYLPNPFSEDFNFEDPLNRSWLFTIHDPSLERLAPNPDAPGCGGVPAFGRARVEGNEPELRDFCEFHLQELTQVRTATLALLPGVKVFVVTTYRGGTGTGATTTGSAVLRSVMDGGKIHLHVLMPCIYKGDGRTYANAYAMLRENQWYHSFKGWVPMKGDRLLKAPFDSVTLIFASNGTVALSHVDALMQEAAILRSYLRAPTQAAINTREVDLTDVIPYDLEDKPMHVRVETAISIRSMPPGIQDYLATEWIRQELEVVQNSFETWCRFETLTPEEESRLNEVVESAIKDVALNRNALLTRLEPSPTPTNALRNFFETAIGMVGSMKAGAIKQSMANLPQQIRDAFIKFERTWEDRVRQLAVALPREITDYVFRKMAASPHLALAALSKIRGHLAGLAKDAAEEAEKEKKKRDAAGAQFGPALNAVQEAKGILGIIHTDEVTRDAAHKACSIAMSAALARAQQQRLEYLVKVLEGEMTSKDSLGKSITVPSVTVALRDIQIERIAAIRKHQAAQLETLNERLDDLSKQISRRSQVFQRSLQYDGINRERLDKMVQNIRERIPKAPPIDKFLEGSSDLTKTLADILPLLPSYAESGRSLTQILDDNPAKRNLVIQLLRNRKPFTPINSVVEEQQGLRNRRDTLVIIELPGGQDGALAELLLREGIIKDKNQLVDSGSDEIRLYYMRDGLPYAAIEPLARYKERHDRYLANVGAITPYTLGINHFPSIEPSRTNLRLHTEELLYVAKGVLPRRVVPIPSGGFTLHYEKKNENGFTTPDNEEFSDFDSMVNWLAKRVEERKAIEAELKEHLDRDSNAYKDALISAWRQANGNEKFHLEHACFKIGVNPHGFADALSAKSPQSL